MIIKPENITTAYLGKNIAIEYAKDWGFEPLSYLAKCYFEKLGCTIVYFHSNPIILIKNKFKKTKICNTNTYSSPSLLQCIAWSIKSFFWTLKNYCLILIKTKNIFELHIKGVTIGDSIVAQSVRVSNQSPSQLRFDKFLFKSLIQGYLTFKYAEWLMVEKKVETLMLSHNMYCSSIFSRVILKNGAKYLYVGKFPFSVIVDSKISSPYYPFILPLHKFDSLLIKEKEMVKNYLTQRVDTPKNILPYMKVDIESTKETKNSLNILELNKNPKNTINVCIFLHSFADALFICGPDSFNDIWHWLTFTIENLLFYSQKKPINILIKPHPNIFLNKDIKSTVLQKDYLTYEYLEKLHQSNNKVKFIPASTSNIELTKLPNFIAITHHGNVAPELAFLGKPVIASFHAPWKNCNDFLITWKNKDDYADILNSLEDCLKFQVCEESLLKFAYYYYLKFNKRSNGALYADKLFRIAFDRNPLSDLECQNMSNEVLDVFKTQSNKFTEGKDYFEQLIMESIEFYLFQN
ncbi:hypothetical protein JJD41_12290 [Oxynema sp. CENA135]|uniref:hypothetical protein n=1 Tax=Oxynema sp. CENA135 TaxID=984206 RepID=UPI00190C2C59|nr:hypothetical protein [Oxynema sp. CENA135]MBK4730637.1 hypothetical protein [Oxynema sp. CENA135]